MDPNQPVPPPRKVRFTPKGPPRRKPKPSDPKGEVKADKVTGEDEAHQALLRRVNENVGRRGPKAEKQSSVQVAFTHGIASSAPIRTYGIPREGNSGKTDGLGLKDTAAYGEQILFSAPSTAKPDGTAGSSIQAFDASYQKKKKDYKEPWDYYHSNYPVTLPWRRPYSGEPGLFPDVLRYPLEKFPKMFLLAELLDEVEFGDAARHLDYDENTINPAVELGLLDENDKPQLLFLQFPANLPLVKGLSTAAGKERTDSLKPSGSKSASTTAKGKEKAGRPGSLWDSGSSAVVKGKETVGGSVPSRTGNTSKMCCNLEELPGGYMGKMLVYKSGAIKWKIGDVVYDVSPGLSCACAQDVAAINTADKNYCVLGELGKRLVLTPDIDSLLDNTIDLG